MQQEIDVSVRGRSEFWATPAVDQLTLRATPWEQQVADCPSAALQFTQQRNIYRKYTLQCKFVEERKRD